MNYFFDTSALVKFYNQEEGSESVKSIIDKESFQISISELTSIEFYSVFHRLLRTKELTKFFVNKVLGLFESDCKTRYNIHLINSTLISKAKEIIKRHGDKKSIRTLDAMQIATALILNKKNTVVSSDRVFLEIAKKESLKVTNPTK